MNKKTSAKNKVIGILSLWLVLTASMFLYFFKIVDSSNQTIIGSIQDQQKNLQSLNAERDVYLKGQQDLETMKSNVYQPGNFFTQDVTLVKEIETLEHWANLLNVHLDLSGLSGTVNTAVPVGTDGNIVQVSYSITLTGSFAKVVDYIQVMENLDFITTVSALTLNGGSGDSVTANLGAVFYIRANKH